ncbi:MAG: antibiotic biosynthesis monooxygenase [Rhizobiales bacterium]|nr:antibiotic biosynthesis monooxygenase [Hyphomicrobiales bacterium]
MHAVIFEFWPADGRQNDYFDHVAALKAELDKVEGFISVERFESLTEPGKFLSLSFWEGEEALTRWRNIPRHRKSQAAGRAGILANYRLRIAGVVRDYGMNERGEAPDDSKAVHQ